MKYLPFVALSFLLLATSVRADEIRLKDGSKIMGTIVGFEGDSFKVQTSYGFAMIRKDSIAEIIPTEAKKPSASSTTAPSSAEKPALEPVSEKNPSAPMPKPRAEAKTAPPAVATPASTPPSNPAVGAPAANPATASAASAAPVSVAAAPVAPPPPPAPEPIRETIRGNLYVNQTFGFQMFRPPGWDLIADAGKALPNAITALGTSDETTLLVVGHDPLADGLDAHAAATDRKLRDIYANYRPLSTQHVTIAGSPAVETRFRGALGDRDWSVTVATLSRGKEAFTLLAMTYADSDLMQIQENVIAKTIASLQFTAAN
jgi:hypothetical protein